MLLLRQRSGESISLGCLCIASLGLPNGTTCLFSLGPNNTVRRGDPDSLDRPGRVVLGFQSGCSGRFRFPVRGVRAVVRVIRSWFPVGRRRCTTTSRHQGNNPPKACPPKRKEARGGGGPWGASGGEAERRARGRRRPRRRRGAPRPPRGGIWPGGPPRRGAGGGARQGGCSASRGAGGAGLGRDERGERSRQNLEGLVGWVVHAAAPGGAARTDRG